MTRKAEQFVHWWKEIPFSFVCFLFQGKAIKPELNYSMKSFNFFMQCVAGYSPHMSLL